MRFPSNCPLCRSRVKSPSIVTKHIYGDKSRSKSFYICSSCDVRFMFPRLTPLQEKIFYKKEFEGFMNKRAGNSQGWLNAEEHVKKNKTTFERRFKYIKKHLKKNSDILEIGCSSGFMLYPLRKLGHKCHGIEPSGYFEKYLKRKKINTYKTLDILLKKNIKFDLIIHFFVLEHISEPLDFLKKLISLLKKKGKIIFEIPNVAEPLHTIYTIKEFEKFYWSIAHPWYFNEKSLKFLMNKLSKKYNIELDQRYDLSNHLNWIINGKPGGMKKFSHLLGKNLERQYKNKLLKSKKCDTLIGIINNG